MSIVESNGGAILAAQQLSPDMMLLKMENESIMAVARTAPRDPMKIVQQLQQLIDAYPAAADDAIYRKPVGTVMEITCECGIKYEANIKWVNRKPVADKEPCPNCGEFKPKKQESVKKYAEGLSARAAESIRSIFGYTRLATTTEVQEDGKARITGVLVDYAAGNITSDERVVSPFYKTRDGTMTRQPEDRFLNLTVKSEISKLRRDVILLSTPNIVKACFKDACEQKIRGLISDEVIEQKIIPAFAAFGITPDKLDKIIGRPHALGWKEEQRLECRKILSALKNEETTVAELLAGLGDDNGAAPAAGKTAPKSAGVTMADSTGTAPEPPFNPPTAAEQAAAEPEATGPEDYPAPQSQDATPAPAAEFVLDEWLEAVAAAETIKRVREIVDSTKGISSPHDRETVVSACAQREEEIRGTRGERTNGGKPQHDPLEWTREAAGKCITFPDYKKLDGQIGAAQWHDDVKAAARRVVEEVKAAKRAANKR